MKTFMAGSKEMARPAPAQVGKVRDWQRWAPYTAVAWSLSYAALGVSWAVSGNGFPYTPKAGPNMIGPLLEKLGTGVAWTIVIVAGIPAAVVGLLMLGEVRRKEFRFLLITTGALLSGILLLLMTSLNLLVLLGYLPYLLFRFITGAEVSSFTGSFAQWATLHELLCLIGGFLWLAATVRYARRSGDACLYCGRRAGPEGWASPENAGRWGRVAVFVAMVAPVFYTFTRYVWALGIPLGMSAAYLQHYQESGMWISGLFLATFGLVGAGLMLGLVQPWGEVFPRWMIGLAGRRVPIALAVIPALLVSVLLIVGGTGIWFGLEQMEANLAASGVEPAAVPLEIFFQVGPTLLFPIWGLALAVAALGYNYRRRGPCNRCGRGKSSQN